MKKRKSRAASHAVSSAKKKGGHAEESRYARLIGGQVKLGQQKPDVIDAKGQNHSVKSQRKWQIFLYRENKIRSHPSLSIFTTSLDAFPRDYSLYEEHKKICLNFKENYITKHGIVAAKNLTNEELSVELGLNEYLDSKIKLATATSKVCSYLSIKNNLRDFLEEAFFSGSQVQFLAITKSPMCTDSKFRVFDRNDVVDVLERKIIVDSSMAGRDVRDLNVAAQKVLLKHVNPKGKLVNLGEIEIRNDSSTHYREVRFNVYSKEILQILNDEYRPHGVKQVGAEILVFGNARKNLP